MKGYADLADLPEDERIDIIGRTAAGGQIVGFFVDDQKKAARYIKKLLANHAIRVLDVKQDAVVKNTVMVRVGPKES